MDFEISKRKATCPGCTADFDLRTHTPFIGSCSHSVCSVCANEKSFTTCPVCHNPGGFLWMQENELAKELLANQADKAVDKCPNCVEDFDCDTRIPIIGSCGHRLCSSCANNETIKACLLCNNPDAFLGNQRVIDRDLVVSLIEEKVKKTTAVSCPGCSQEFDLERHAPFIGSCGHSVCSVCANNKKIKACPVCSTRRSFQWKRKNELTTELLAILAEKKAKKLRLETGKPEKVPPILNVNNIEFLARILNELDRSSFVKLARTCATMHKLCFNTKGVKIPYDVFWLCVSGTYCRYQGLTLSLVEFEKEYDEELDYPFESTSNVDYSLGYLGCADNRKKLRNSPFVLRVKKLELSGFFTEKDFLQAQSFLREFPIETISEVIINVFPSWKLLIQLLKDFNIRDVTIISRSLGRTEEEVITEEDEAYFFKNIDSFRCDMNFRQEYLENSTVQRLHLENVSIDQYTFEDLLKRFANSTEEIHWTFRLYTFENPRLYLYKSLPLDYDGPLPEERPLVFGDIAEPFRFWILRKDGKRLRCFGDNKQIVLSTPMFYN